MKNDIFGNLAFAIAFEQEKNSEKYENLDFIFDKSKDYKKSLPAITSDNVIAMRRLDNLTNILRLNNLRHKSKSFCSYFML